MKGMYAATPEGAEERKTHVPPTGSGDTDKRLQRLMVALDEQEKVVDRLKVTVNDLCVTCNRLTTNNRKLIQKVEKLEQTVQQMKDDPYGARNNG